MPPPPAPGGAPALAIAQRGRELLSLRRARCEEFFGDMAVERINRIHLPLRVERVEERRERKRSRGPYYANEDEATFRMTGGHPRS